VAGSEGQFQKKDGVRGSCSGAGLWGLLGRVIEGVQLTKWEWLTGGRGSGSGH